MDLFLKFESEAQATPFLYDVVTEYRDPDGRVIPAIVDKDGSVTQPENTVAIEVKKPKFLNLDIIGEIYKPTGTVKKVQGPIGEELEIPEVEKLDGWHANVRITNEDSSQLEQFAITPANPVRVWA